MLPPKTYNENMSLENDSSSENHAEDVGDAGGSEINQYDDGNQQSVTARLFDNNETGGTDSAHETHESQEMSRGTMNL